MRISVRKDDPGYSPLAPHAIVFLDGIRQYQCITADSDEGWIIRYRQDGRGNFVEAWGHKETERVEGRVDIFIEQ